MFMIVRSINVVLKIHIFSGINCILFIFYWKNKIIIIMYTHKMNIFCLFSLSEVEQALTHVPENLDRYYKKNSLKLNPTKTQISAFHFNNRQSR